MITELACLRHYGKARVNAGCRPGITAAHAAAWNQQLRRNSAERTLLNAHQHTGLKTKTTSMAARVNNPFT